MAAQCRPDHHALYHATPYMAAKSRFSAMHKRGRLSRFQMRSSSSEGAPDPEPLTGSSSSPELSLNQQLAAAARWVLYSSTGDTVLV